MDGVTGASVIQLEAQKLDSRQTVATAAQSYTRGSELLQVNSHDSRN